MREFHLECPLLNECNEGGLYDYCTNLDHRYCIRHINEVIARADDECEADLNIKPPVTIDYIRPPKSLGTGIMRIL
jgi:hypothetical protein